MYFRIENNLRVYSPRVHFLPIPIQNLVFLKALPYSRPATIPLSDRVQILTIPAPMDLIVLVGGAYLTFETFNPPQSII